MAPTLLSGELLAPEEIEATWEQDFLVLMFRVYGVCLGFICGFLGFCCSLGVCSLGFLGLGLGILGWWDLVLWDMHGLGFRVLAQVAMVRGLCTF